MAKKGSPNFNLPSSLYPEFLQVIEGSDHPKAVLVDELYKAFKDRPELVGTGIGALRKGAVESKIAEIAFKEKKVWRVRPKEWVCVCLPTTAGPAQ
jgi:chromatin assembly factor 1 subunit A